MSQPLDGSVGSMQTSFMKLKKRLSATTLVISALIAGSMITAAAPAQAATATWYSGKACHNVWRTETGSTLSLSRYGQEVGGWQTGRYTLQYGSMQTTVRDTSFASIQTAGKKLNKWRGRYKVEIQGGKTGECSGNQNTARAFGVPTGGMRSAPTDPVLSSDLNASQLESSTQYSVGQQHEVVAISREDYADGSTVMIVETDEAIVVSRHDTDTINQDGYDMQFSNEAEAYDISVDSDGDALVEER